MKKLINAVQDVVTEQLQGLAVAHAELVKAIMSPGTSTGRC
jgi:dihydroxyacetone kinase